MTNGSKQKRRGASGLPDPLHTGQQSEREALVRQAGVAFARSLDELEPGRIREVIQFMDLYGDAIPYMMAGEWARKISHALGQPIAGLDWGLLGARNIIDDPDMSSDDKIAKLKETRPVSDQNGMELDVVALLELNLDTIRGLVTSMDLMTSGHVENVSKLDKGGIEELITQALKFSSGPEDASRKIGRYRLNIEDDIPAVSVKPHRLTQVMTNILTNAKQAMWMSEGESHLDITVGRGVGDKKDVVEMIIRDTGPGIKEGWEERIYVLGETTKPNGTGFGVPISKKMMREMGGDLVVRNRTDGVRGAESIITMQLAQ